MFNPFTKIGRLKNKLRTAYLTATYLPDHVDCGLHMYHIIRPDLAQSEYIYDKIAAELKELGEPVPEFRFHENN